jgi:hypothetical protein
MRKYLLAGVAGLLVTVPSPAFAASNSVSDPTGDTSVASNDISQVGVNFDHSMVTVTLTTAAALPPITDSSWTVSGTSSGRVVVVSLEGGLDPGTADLSVPNITQHAQDVDDSAAGDGFPSENYGAFVLTSDGVAADSLSDHGEVGCKDATYDITGLTLTMSAPASCFGNLGSIKAEAVIAGPTDAATDLAISNNLSTASSVNASVPGGYYLLGSDGGVFSFDAPFYGSTGSLKLNSPVVGMADMPGNDGYRFVAGDGGVFSYGSAQFYGSMGGKPLNKPIVGMTTTPDGKGYWLVASDGGIFAYGDAEFYGSMGGKPLNKAIVGIAATPDGKGYWEVASDGGIFAYGDAAFYGSMGGKVLNKPIVGMTSSPSGKGYWFVASDGGVFNFGDASFYGSGTQDFDNDVVGIGQSNGGYHLVGSHGDVFSYGPSYDYGDAYRDEIKLNGPLVGMAEVPTP